MKAIHCFDRSSTAKNTYTHTFPDYEKLLLRVTFHHSLSLDSANLGMKDDMAYAELHQNATSVIHNAWPVNFQLPLQSAAIPCIVKDGLESHVGGVTALIEFASTAQYQPRILFMSSLSTVVRYTDPETGAVPESIIKDSSAPDGSGYARRKWLDELVLDAASKAGMITPPLIARIDQIAAPLPHVKVVHGMGSKRAEREAVPSMMISFKAIKSLPMDLLEKDKLRWVPVNVCAKALLGIMEPASKDARSSLGSSLVYNVTNIQQDAEEQTRSTDMVQLLAAHFREACSGRPIKIQSLAEWVDEVAIYGAKPDNPAMELLNFYQELATSDPNTGLGARINTTAARAASASLRGLGPVLDEWLEHWMEAWKL